MKKVLALSTLLAFSVNVYTQITFQKTYGGTMAETGDRVLQTSDGGYITLGGTASLGDATIYLVKTNSYGDTLWTKSLGGTDTESGSSISQTADGGYIIGGTIRFFPAASATFFYLVKTNSTGDTLWTRIYSSISFAAKGYCARQTNEGGYIIVGSTNTPTNPVSRDIYLIKTDSIGNMVWRKSYGGPFEDDAFSVMQTTDNGYIIAGYRCDSSFAYYDIYLLKTDGSGNLLWSKTYGGAGDDYGYSAQQTNDGGYIISGQSNSFSAGNYEVYLIKTDGNGDTLWTKTFTGVGATVDYSVIQTSDGGYAISGNNFIKTDSNGSLLWTRRYGITNSNGGKYACQTNDGGYIIIGTIGSCWSSSCNDVYLVKTDAFGNSGCNETVPSITAATPPTQVAQPVTTVTSPSIIPPGFIPASFGSGGIISTYCTSFPTEINESKKEENFFFLSPNPATNQLTINNGELKIKRIEIYNVLGERTFQYQISNPKSQFSINVSQLPPGIYFLKVRGEKEDRVAKFVKH